MNLHNIFERPNTFVKNNLNAFFQKKKTKKNKRKKNNFSKHKKVVFFIKQFKQNSINTILQIIIFILEGFFVGI